MSRAWVSEQVISGDGPHVEIDGATLTGQTPMIRAGRDLSRTMVWPGMTDFTLFDVVDDTIRNSWNRSCLYKAVAAGLQYEQHPSRDQTRDSLLAAIEVECVAGTRY